MSQIVDWRCPVCGQKLRTHVRVSCPPVCDHEHGERRAMKPSEMKPVEPATSNPGGSAA